MEERIRSLERRVTKLETAIAIWNKEDTLTARFVTDAAMSDFAGTRVEELTVQLENMNADMVRMNLCILEVWSEYNHKAKISGFIGDRRYMSLRDVLLLDLLDAVKGIPLAGRHELD